MLDVRMKDENTSWQEWYEKNPIPRSAGRKREKLVHGVGVNDLDYVCGVNFKDEHGKQTTLYSCNFYRTWERILRRSYQKIWLDKHPSYTGAAVSPEFKSAKLFKNWMLSQVYKEDGKLLHIDKDILIPGNKLYSPETCAFVPDFINWCLSTSERAIRTLPVGVSKSGYRFLASIANGRHNKSTNFGTYATAEDAHRVWQYARASRIEDRIEKYSTMKCFRADVAEALYLRVIKLREDAENGAITTSI